MNNLKRYILKIILKNLKKKNNKNYILKTI